MGHDQRLADLPGGFFEFWSGTLTKLTRKPACPRTVRRSFDFAQLPNAVNGDQRKKSGWVKVEMSIYIGTDALSEAGSKHPCADIPSRHFLRRAVGRGHHL